MNFLLSQFFYDKSRKTLTAEASELKIPVGFMPEMVINVISDKTGTIFSFFRQREDDEMFFYTANDECPVKSLFIFND